MKVASYAPGQSATVQFAISADDCLLHFDADQLTPKQRADDESNKNLIPMLQVGSLFIAKPQDRVALYEGFQSREWPETLARFQAFFAALGLEPAPLSSCSFEPRDDFYARLAADPPPVDQTTVYLVSGSNAALHRGTSALDVSRDVNSKMTLAREAAGHGIPVPESLVLRHDELDGPAAREFFEGAGDSVMLKIMGLAGARNVTRVRSGEEARDWLAEFPADLEVLLQHALPAATHTEMTADLTISEGGIEIANIRRILFQDGLWVGNYVSDRLELSERQRQALLDVGAWVRSKGYSAPEGLNCGIDFFVSGDDISVIEVNARWTGGLIPAEMVQRLGLGGGDTVVAFDTIATQSLPAFLDFNERHLPGAGRARFASVPLGFSPYVFKDDAGVERMFVWQLVSGDLGAFRSARDDALRPGDLAVTGAIVLPER